MLLLNVSANRILREGDRVSVSHGPHAGKPAQVVGFSLTEADCPIVVQYGSPLGYLREELGANDVEFQEGPTNLEPLPNIPKVLQEDGFEKSYKTCGRLLCLTLREDSSVLTFVPKSNETCLFEFFQTLSFEDAVNTLTESSFVTRLPHLVSIGSSKQVGQMLFASTEEALSLLLRR